MRVLSLDKFLKEGVRNSFVIVIIISFSNLFLNVSFASDSSCAGSKALKSINVTDSLNASLPSLVTSSLRGGSDSLVQ